MILPEEWDELWRTSVCVKGILVENIAEDKIEGKEVVPCVYDVVASFNEELAVVCKNDKWGFVNTKGELAIPCTYDFAFDFSEGLATIRKNGKYGFIKEGKIVLHKEADVIREEEAKSIDGLFREVFKC